MLNCEAFNLEKIVNFYQFLNHNSYLSIHGLNLN